MIWLYIYLGTIALHLIGYFILVAYGESVLRKRGIKRLSKSTASELVLAWVRIIFFSILPVINVILFLAYILGAEPLTEKVIEKVQLENEEYLNGQRE